MDYVNPDDLVQFTRTFKAITGLTLRQLQDRTGVANATLSRVLTRNQLMDMGTYGKLMQYFSTLGKEQQ